MNETDFLLTPLEDKRSFLKGPIGPPSPLDNRNPGFFIEFLNNLEGWKTKCKNLHWSAPKKNIHVYLDEFLAILQIYQDSLAEGYMGILPKMPPNAIKGTQCEALNAMDFITDIISKTLMFYDNIPSDTAYKGIASECETFIQDIFKYKYLFGLCNWKSDAY